MKINLRDYKNDGNESGTRRFVLSKDEIDINQSEDFDLVDDVSVDIVLLVVGELLKIDFHICAKFEFICSRCLSRFIHDFDLSFFEEMLMSDLDDDIVLDSDDDIDLTNYIRGHIVSNIPQKKLCGSACLGLCQFCGTNLNDVKCTCNYQIHDGPFSVLREGLVDLKEVE